MSEPELNDIWASEVVRLRDERDRLREALECAGYALAHPESDQAFALRAVEAALTPAGQRWTRSLTKSVVKDSLTTELIPLTPNEATE